MNRDRTIIIIIVVFLILAIVGVGLYFGLFYKKQQKRQDALAQGYGSYSDPIFYNCVTPNNNCNLNGVQTIMRHCVPHPITGKGCINDEGYMTYNTIQDSVVCKQQCVASNFTYEDGVQVKRLEDSRLITTESGCNNIISSSTGLDYTNYFLGPYISGNNTYQLNRCIPKSGYQGYYQDTYTCNQNDIANGTNNCNFSCGQAGGTLQSNGLFSNKLSKNILNYYPTEYDQEGNLRHVCYDINDLNQIEILNSVENVPNDFYYPEKCYQHAFVNNIGVSKIYPLGTSNVYSSNKFYLSDEEYFESNPLSNIYGLSLIDQNYNILYNYNSYVKLNINSEISLLSNFVQSENDKFPVISLEGSNINCFIQTTGSPIGFKLTYEALDNYNNNSFSFLVDYGLGDNALKMKLDMSQFLFPDTHYTPYEFDGTSSLVRYDGEKASAVGAGSWFYYHINDYEKYGIKRNNGRLIRIEGTNTTPSWTGSSGNYYYFTEDLGPDATKYGICVRLLRFKGDNVGVYPTQTPGFKSKFNIEDIVITNNLDLPSEFIINESQTYRLRYDSEKFIANNEGTSFYYFGTDNEKENTGYYYPLILFSTPPSTGFHQHTFDDVPGITFYMPNGQNNHGTLVPPPKDCKNFDEEFGFGSIKLFNSNGVASEAQIYQGGKYDKTLFTNNQGNIYFGDTVAGIDSLTFSDTKSPDYVKVLRSNNQFFTYYNSNFSNLANNVSLYYQMIIDEVNRRFLKNDIYNITIFPQKEVVMTADFSVFKSPFLKLSDNSLESFCFDQYGKPLPAGTAITLEPGEQIVIYKPCNDFRTTPGTSPYCGFYGVSVTGQYCVQERETTFPLFETNSEVIDFGKYKAYKNFLEMGINFTNPEYTLKCFDNETNVIDDSQCTPIYFTKEYKENRVYAPGEELFFTRRRQEYYLSLIDNNSYYPLNPQYWRRIFAYQPNLDVDSYQSLMIQENETSFVFQTNNKAVMGENPYKLGVAYQYTKPQSSIFITNLNDANGESYTPGPLLPHKDYYELFHYNDGRGPNSPPNFQLDNFKDSTFEIGTSVNLISDGLSASGLSLRNKSFENIACNFEFSYPINDNNNVVVGDIFNPDFSFFNGFLFYMKAIYQSFDSDEIGIISKPLPGITFNIRSNKTFFDLNTDFINYDSINPEVKKGDYYFITINFFEIVLASNTLLSKKIPRNVGVRAVMDILYGCYSQNTKNDFVSLYDIMNQDIINPTSEIILIEDIDSKNKKIKIKRNILNLNKENYFCYNNISTTLRSDISLALQCNLLSENFITDLKFPITKKENNRIFFNTTFYLPAYSIDYCRQLFLNNYSFDGFNLSYNNSPVNFFYNSLTYAFSARIIKSQFTTPHVSRGGSNLYLASSKDYTRVRSILTTILIKDQNNIYINEYRENGIPTFYINDIINIENFKVKIIATEEFYYQVDNNNLITNYKFDYKCAFYTTNQNRNTLFTNFVNTIINKSANTATNPYSKYLDNQNGLSVYSSLRYTNSPISVIEIPIASPSPFNNNYTLKNTISGPSTNSTGICINPYNDLSSQQIISGYANDQVYLDQANNIIYLNLDTTTIISDVDNSNRITITNIEVNGKPDGPTYLTTVAKDNSLDRSGYGTITSFSLDTNTVISSGTYISPHGFVFKTTNKPVASYSFEDVKRIPLIQTYEDDLLYSTADIVEFTNPNERVYYENQSNQALTYGVSDPWVQIPASTYNENSSVDFSFGNSYLKGDNVIYKNKFYTALKDNFATYPGISPSIWQEQIFDSVNDLISNKNFFYSFSESGPSISAEDLLEFKFQNDQNYPLGIYDYEDKRSFCPQETINFDLYGQLDYSNSFIQHLDGVCELGPSIGKSFFIKPSSAEVLSLITSPYSLDQIEKTRTYINNTTTGQEITIGQYLYTVPLENPEAVGLPYCTGQSTFICGEVSYLDFANSIFFTFAPLSLEDQDFPAFGVSEGLSCLVANFPGQFSPNSGMSFKFILEDENNNNNYGSCVSGVSSSYITVQPTTLNSSGTYSVSNGTSSLTLNSLETNFVPAINNIGQSCNPGDPWYVKSGSSIVSFGYINNHFESNSNKFEDFSIIKYPAESSYQGLDLYIINNNYKSAITVSGISTFITKFDFDQPDFSVSPGLYQGDGLAVYVNVNKYQKALSNTQYTIGTSSPSLGTSMTSNYNYYAVLRENELKTKLYGLFSTSNFGNIVYQLEKKFPSDIGNIPGLIFQEYKNNLFSQDEEKVIQVYDQDEQKVVSYNNNYNTFIIDKDYNLKTNYYDYPIKNRSECNILEKAFKDDNTDISQLAYSQTNKVKFFDFKKFTAKPKYLDTFENLVNITGIRDSAPNNANQLFNRLRSIQNVGLSVQFNCNIYNNIEKENNQYPGGKSYDIVYINNKINYQPENNNAPIDIKTNNTYVFFMNNSNSKHPVSIGLSSGTEFSGSIITDNTHNFDSERGLIITYSLGQDFVSYDDYINTVIGTSQRILRLVYTTPITQTVTPPSPIYIGNVGKGTITLNLTNY